MIYSGPWDHIADVTSIYGNRDWGLQAAPTSAYFSKFSTKKFAVIGENGQQGPHHLLTSVTYN